MELQQNVAMTQRQYRSLMQCSLHLETSNALFVLKVTY